MDVIKGKGIHTGEDKDQEVSDRLQRKVKAVHLARSWNEMADLKLVLWPLERSN